MGLAAHRNALWVLIVVSFAESSFFPIPPDALLLPMILDNRDRARLYASACTVASVAGGLFGYAIGYFLYDAVAEPVMTLYGYADKFAEFQAAYNAWGAWIVAGAGA